MEYNGYSQRQAGAEQYQAHVKFSKLPGPNVEGFCDGLSTLKS